MIDWQVTVNGQFPDGWDQHKDGCWFPDFGAQEYLLPYFNVGDQPIDEYGATTFNTDAAHRLRRHLEWQRSYWESKSSVWKISESSDGNSHSYEIKRDVVLLLVDKTIQMIGRAIELNGQLIFRGD